VTNPEGTTMKRFTYSRPRGFALEAASNFYQGFTPGSGMAAAIADRLTLAFRLDGSFEAVAVALREEGKEVVAEYTGTKDEAAVRKQVARMLGLDVDGDAWLAVGKRDPVVGKLQAEFPGFFTAAKPSPYDAAIWGVIAQRLNMKQAAKLKTGMAKKHGDAVTLAGSTHHVFPSPAQLAKVRSFPGLSDEKVDRLHGLAGAALKGELDADRLRAMDEHEALEKLQALRGVGPWTASHILYRGAALQDALPEGEPRVLHGMAAAYGLESASVETYRRLGEQWRPFRMWVCILLARHLNRAGGWNKPGLREERAAAGRATSRRRKPSAEAQTPGFGSLEHAGVKAPANPGW
jgi:DNA-3-methyladenine glycosylase II